MASVSTDPSHTDTDSEHGLASCAIQRSDDSSILSCLPEDHILRSFNIWSFEIWSFSPFKHLQKDAQQILDSLEKNGDGNQWLVVLNLSAKSIEKLDNDHKNSLGGINYRFQWQGTTGLIKIIPSPSHEIVTDRITHVIRELSSKMGHGREGIWLKNTTYKVANEQGKQPDQAFAAPSRQTPEDSKFGWPNFVIETGVSKSIHRLRQNAKKWFRDSQGQVRIVLLVSINLNSSEISFEKWQLAPLNSPTPLTRAYIDSLRAQPRNVPPTMGPQAAALQKAYSAQEIYVRRNGTIVGAPLVLHFEALWDRMAEQGEQDFVITEKDFQYITEYGWFKC